MARTETRHHDISSHDRARWAADVQDVAERARRWREARDAYRPTGERLKTLRHAHAVIVELIAKRAGVTIGHPGAVPDGLDVPGHRELVEEIHALDPWFPPPDACVRGAADEDSLEVVRVLIALERGYPLTAACELAIGSRDRRRTPDGDALRKRMDRVAPGERKSAYGRWREALERHINVAERVSVAGETREERRERVTKLRALLALPPRPSNSR